VDKRHSRRTDLSAIGVPPAWSSGDPKSGQPNTPAIALLNLRFCVSLADKPIGAVDRPTPFNIEGEALLATILETRDISKSFDTYRHSEPTHVLKGISLSVALGEMVTIVGPSGSGKSTLMQCMSGLDAVTSGQVNIGGTDIGALDLDQAAAFRRDNIAFVFQSYNLIPAFTAFDNVALAMRMSRGAVDRPAVLSALDSVDLAGVADRRPGQLSGGQQQRVAIARALATLPRLLFADEPTGALDTEAGSRVLKLLRDYASEGKSVVMVTHDLEAAALGDRVLVIRDGRIHDELHSPTVTEVLASVEHARRS
jgi:putative ABC transport system ATP-binding protein